MGGVEQFVLELARTVGGGVLSFAPGADPAAVSEWSGLRVFAPGPDETPQAAWHRALDTCRPRAVLVHQLGPVGPALLLDLAEREIPYALYLHDFSPNCPIRTLWHRREQRCEGPGDTGFKCAWCLCASPRRLLELPLRTLQFQARPQAWRTALSRAEALVVGSRFQREFWLDQGAPPERLALIPPWLGRPVEAPGPTPERRLLYASGWRPANGAELLAEALALMDRPLSLVVAGESPAGMRARLRALIPAQHQIEFAGPLPPERMPALIQSCTLVVAPTRWDDPFGRMTWESWAAGRMVVASAVGGLPEIVIHGVNGFLSEPDDPSALAQSLREGLAAAAGWSADCARSWTAAQAAECARRLRQLGELLVERRAEPALTVEQGGFLAWATQNEVSENGGGHEGAEERARDRLVEALRERPVEAPPMGQPPQLDDLVRRRAYDASLRSRLDANFALAHFHAQGCRVLADLDPGLGATADWFREWGWPTRTNGSPLQPEGIYACRGSMRPDRRLLHRRFPGARLLVRAEEDGELCAEPLTS